MKRIEIPCQLDQSSPQVPGEYVVVRKRLMLRIFGCVLLFASLSGCEIRSHARIDLIDGYLQDEKEQYPFRTPSDSELRVLFPRLKEKNGETLVLAESTDLKVIYCGACQYALVVAINDEQTSEISVLSDGYEFAQGNTTVKGPNSAQTDISKNSGRLRRQGEAADGLTGAAFSIVGPSTYQNYDKTFDLTIPILVNDQLYEAKIKFKYRKSYGLKETIGVPGT